MTTSNEPKVRTTAAQGAKDAAPILLGILPWGVIAGAGATEAGFSVAGALGFSLFVFAGAAQVAALELCHQQAPPLVIVLTMGVINLRYLMYSAALAPHLPRLPLRWKGLVAYLLTDQAFAITVARQRSRPGAHPQWYYLGGAAAIWMSYQVGTCLGVGLGALLPVCWELDFAVPLVFLALLVPLLRNRGGRAAALTAAVTVIVAHAMPLGTGLLVAAAIGVSCGLVAQRLRQKAEPGRGEL